MNIHSFNEVLDPDLVWGYNCKNKMVHLGRGREECDILDYRNLVHADDIARLNRLIKENLEQQKCWEQRPRKIMSLMRVKSSTNKHHLHISIITLRCTRNGRLARLCGVNYRIPGDASLDEPELDHFTNLLGSATERLNPFLHWAAASVRRRDRTRGTEKTRAAQHTKNSVDPFSQTWRCSNLIIYPSLFQMVDVSKQTCIEISEKQSRFITLMLSAQNAGGTPAYVQRTVTRRQVFNTDPSSPINDNDIDHLVRFFRQHLGEHSIETKRGYGHVLKCKRHVYEGCDLENALSLLWGINSQHG